ncbi:hypothetical protein [Streptomyces sp. NBC_01022]|uniref:hypothetical protein n=1 Tax=Streptomyces sp. NBC_01022 TaxID=2903723 RepID=UPI002DDA2344|nr:hypothetical protein [Streptomyces sp. NBC_01022]WRZ79525.1 hypothetical protein OG316_04215 [Streptomyces sp. NBC_01022]
MDEQANRSPIALKDKGTPVPEIAKKLVTKTGKNADEHPSVASVYRALADAEEAAVDRDHPAVSIGTLRHALPRGLTLSGLRQDRILNEAAESADPLRLMCLFGITEQTAMRYVGAAHPERTAKLPR